MHEASFGEVLLLSDQPPSACVGGIEWRQIRRLGSRQEYSRFMLRELAEHIRTSHALCVQWDGFVTNGSAWDPRFLNYDYIGAVWPHFADLHNVGNGGFSLRSRRLLVKCRDLPFDGSQLEDVVIARICRDRLEREGIRFAPEQIARRFSYERTAPTGGEFGFHGCFNLFRHLGPDGALRLFRSLERGMLARSERAELLRWAVVNRRPAIALEMLRRLV